MHHATTSNKTFDACKVMRPYWRKLTFKCDSAAGQEAKVIQAVWIVILLAEKIFFGGVCVIPAF